MGMNNFGGKGPDSGPEEIRFKYAANYECEPIDLVMKALSPYTPGATPNLNNGARNGFGYVTTYAGHAVDVELSLVHSETGAPFNVDELSIWMYDLDEGIVVLCLFCSSFLSPFLSPVTPFAAGAVQL